MLLTNFHFFSFLQQILFTTKFFLFSEEVPYQAKSLGYYTKYLLKKIVALALCLVLALSLCATAFAAPATPGTTPTLENQYTKTTDVTATETNSVNVFFAKATEPETNSDDEVIAKGNVAYYTLSTVAGKKYVSVATKGEADIVVYSDSEFKNAVLFLAEMDPEYYVAAATTNFGKNCGQIKKHAAYSKNDTYYLVTGLATDDELYVADDDTPDASLMVGGKLVKASKVGTANYVEHDQTPVVKDGKLVGYKCATCGIDAIKAANYASIPSDAAKSFQGSDGNWYYFPAKAVSGTTSGSKVDSAKTFDAGIALYVGMSISAVAGSAVVIGKKKEF